ncbi:diacylglycerol kinase family protein [Promicromonospora sukumoe]|uniref:diacylglycerol kinase family protein n=1 Tax=Promicromonospora sukumoe TaxID=88382 RepID=UPI0037C9DF2F
MSEQVGHIAVLVNPASGHGAGADGACVAVERLRARGAHVKVYEGADADETVALGRQAVDARPDVVVVAGGDGTVSSVLGPLLSSGIPLALIPGGTGNDLARQHGIPLDDAAAAADLALDGARRRVDTGTVTADDGTVRHFVTVLCAGLDSLTNERTNRMTWPRGPARYLAAVYLEWLRLRRFGYRLEPVGGDEAGVGGPGGSGLDAAGPGLSGPGASGVVGLSAVGPDAAGPTEGGLDAVGPGAAGLDAGGLDASGLEQDGYMLAIGLTRTYGGGVPICPDADPTDGLLDVTLVQAMGRFRLLAFDSLIKAGTHVERPEVTTLRTPAVRLVAPAGLVTYADGEPMGPVPVTIRAHHESLTLCVPA